MRRNVPLAIAALILFVGAATLLPAQGPPPEGRPGWEYRVIHVTEVVNSQQKPEAVTAALEARFNELGNDGWEISEYINGAIVFKRPTR